MSLKKCFWLPYPGEVLPGDAVPVDWNELGSQSAGALTQGLEGSPVTGQSIYRDMAGVHYAVIELEGGASMILREQCKGSLALPYVIGMGLGAAALGVGAAYLPWTRKYRPASTLIGVTAGLILGGGLAHAATKYAYGYGATMPVSGMGLVTATKSKVPPQQVGSLYLPQDGSLPRDTRVGLINAAMRYRPRGKNW